MNPENENYIPPEVGHEQEITPEKKRRLRKLLGYMTLGGVLTAGAWIGAERQYDTDGAANKDEISRANPDDSEVPDLLAHFSRGGISDMIEKNGQRYLVSEMTVNGKNYRAEVPTNKGPIAYGESVPKITPEGAEISTAASLKDDGSGTRMEFEATSKGLKMTVHQLGPGEKVIGTSISYLQEEIVTEN